MPSIWLALLLLVLNLGQPQPASRRGPGRPFGGTELPGTWGLERCGRVHLRLHRAGRAVAGRNSPAPPKGLESFEPLAAGAL